MIKDRSVPDHTGPDHTGPDHTGVRPRRWRGAGRAVALACVVAAAVTGCSGGGAPVRAASDSPSRSAIAHPSTVTLPVPTGPELAKLLPPHTAWPPGWTGLTGAAWTRNLTPQFSKPFAELGPSSAASNPCTDWSIALDGQEAMFQWEMSWAYASARPPHFSASTTPVNVQVADFLPGDAVKQLAWDTAFAARCHTYHDPSDGSLVTITATRTTGVGDQGLYIQVANPYNFGGTMIRARTNVLLVRAGTNMIAVCVTNEYTVQIRTPDRAKILK